MSKVLPCRFCKGNATLPDGRDYTISSHPAPAGTFTYKCSTCKRKSSILASEFNRLPNTELDVRSTIAT